MAWCDLRRDFSHFVVVDFEATCEKDIYLQEIIEFPTVLVDVATGYLLSAFRDTTRASLHFARS
jgi:ERI1 exoribonuclease 2